MSIPNRHVPKPFAVVDTQHLYIQHNWLNIHN